MTRLIPSPVYFIDDERLHDQEESALTGEHASVQSTEMKPRDPDLKSGYSYKQLWCTELGITSMLRGTQGWHKLTGSRGAPPRATALCYLPHIHFKLRFQWPSVKPSSSRSLTRSRREHNAREEEYTATRPVSCSKTEGGVLEL